MVFAEKGQFDIAKDLFTQAQEAASGSFNVQMPDVCINLAHVHFAQGNFVLAVEMYENCLRKFFYNTDSQVLLYLARTHYEAEQWQECKKTLLRAIHLAPSNYTLMFDAGVTLHKFSASTLQKTKRTVDEVRATLAGSRMLFVYSACRLQLQTSTFMVLMRRKSKLTWPTASTCKRALRAC